MIVFNKFILFQAYKSIIFQFADCYAGNKYLKKYFLLIINLTTYNGLPNILKILIVLFSSCICKIEESRDEITNLETEYFHHIKFE